MPENIICPFCNYETTYPTNGRIYECLGECYSTYTLVFEGDNMMRTKMRMVEIFFLDTDYNLSIKPDEIDTRCEFKKMETSTPDQYILFSREFRVEDHHIDNLKEELEDRQDYWVESLERLNQAISRVERNIKDKDYPRTKLYNELRVVETIVANMTDKMSQEAAMED